MAKQFEIKKKDADRKDAPTDKKGKRRKLPTIGKKMRTMGDLY